MMNRILRSALGLAAALGLSACDAAPNTPSSQPVPSEAIAPGETLQDVVRQALEDVLRDKDPFSRARRLGALIPTLGPETAPVVKDLLENLVLDVRGPELDLLLRYWAAHAPEEASLWAKEKSSPSYREGAVFAALNVWAEADPHTAVGVAWEWGAAEPTLESIVPIALVRGWFARGNPPELRQWFGRLPIGILRQRAIAAYIRILMQKEGAEAVMRWAESVPDDDKTFKLAVFRRVVDSLSMLDLEAGIRWCEAHCEGPYGKSMRSLISRNWVVHDGPAALAWLSNEGPGYERELALRVTYSKWALLEHQAAVDWMTERTSGEHAPWVRTLYPIYARLLSGDRPAEAIQWAERIEDEKEREPVVIGVARVWRHLDEAAAEAWLAQSSLSEEAREKARRPVKKRPQPPG